MHEKMIFTVCCFFLFPTQQEKGEEASGGLPASTAPLNQPPPPSRSTHRWHVIARHWLRQTRRRTSGVLPVTTRTTGIDRNIRLPIVWMKHTYTKRTTGQLEEQTPYMYCTGHISAEILGILPFPREQVYPHRTSPLVYLASDIQGVI